MISAHLAQDDWMLKFYYALHTCARASHIALEEAGAKYATVRLDFGAGDQRKAEYLAINPKGRVPALVTERGILTETPAILMFISQMSILQRSPTTKWAKMAPSRRVAARKTDCGVARLGNSLAITRNGRLALDFSGDNASRGYV
jgi:glutathione S-transferase